MKSRIVLKMLSIAALLMTAQPALAGSGKLFSPEVLETTIRELYELTDPARKSSEDQPVLSNEDLASLCDGLGQQIAAQKAGAFNDITGHLLADWRQKPDHRRVIESLLTASRKHAGQILAEQRSKPRPFDPTLSNGERAGVIAMEAIDQAMNVFTALYVFEFGRGLWKSRGQGLTKLEFFKQSLRQASTSALQRRGLMVGGTALATVVDVAIKQLEERYQDPTDELERLRKIRVQEIAVQVVKIRDQLRNGKLPHEQVQSSGDLLMNKLLPEVGHLLRSAPQLSFRIEPIAEDLEECRENLEKLGYIPEETGSEFMIP
jgi:hypothetical protein